MVSLLEEKIIRDLKWKFGFVKMLRPLIRAVSSSYRIRWKKFVQSKERLSMSKNYFLNLEKTYNHDYFSSGHFVKQRRYSTRISEAIESVFSPRSLVDFGCGPGLFLQYFYEKKIQVKGFDGAPAVLRNISLPKRLVEIVDLRKVMKKPAYKYDIALCLEVAEHIEKEFTAILFYNLTNYSDTILFTSPPPGIYEEHPNHPNVQPLEYWEELFGFFGYINDKKLSRLLQNIILGLHLPFDMKHYALMRVYVNKN